MDDERARALLTAERIRVEGLLAGTTRAGLDDRDEANAGGDMADPAQRLTAEQGDDAVAEGLQARLRAIDAAERRLAAGNYGRSIRSGLPIPDERLEADPAAELTVEEAGEAEAVDDLTTADTTVADATLDDATADDATSDDAGDD
jgi:DnaK suppressor protein